MAPLPFEGRTIEVHARCAFPSWNHQEVAWRDQDRNWQLLVLAVKGDRARMKERYCNLPLGNNGGQVRVDRNEIQQAGEWFGRWVGRRTTECGIADPVFVAIPNRNALVDAKDFRTALFARTAAQRFGERARAYTGLRFIEHVSKEEKKRQGVQELVKNMAVIEEVPPGQLVFVDDVYTQGHHISAAIRMLGADRVAPHAFVAGRTVLEPFADMGAELTVEHWYFS